MTKLTSKLAIFQDSEQVEAGEMEQSLRTVFSSVSNLFTNEVKTVKKDENGNSGLLIY